MKRFLSLMVRYFRMFLFVSFISSPLYVCSAQTDSSHLGWWIFESQPYLNPLAAEYRASQMRIDLSLYPPYTYSNAVPKKGSFRNHKNILGMDLAAGKEMPIIGKNCKNFDIGLFVPVSFFMLWDLRGESYPIVNTDYRFGVLIKVFFNSKNFLATLLPNTIQDTIYHAQNDNIERGTGFRLGLFHESSHLGDELMIFALQSKDSLGFKRINVSHEFVDVSYIENLYVKKNIFLQFAVGLTIPAAVLNDKRQYYDDTLLYPFRSVIAQKPPHTESYSVIDIHWYRESLWIPNFFSFEFRTKDVYDYSSTAPNYESVFTYNALIGWRKSKDPGEKLFLYSLGDIYMRMYYGINPHGQFRDQKNFFFLALGMRILG